MVDDPCTKVSLKEGLFGKPSRIGKGVSSGDSEISEFLETPCLPSTLVDILPALRCKPRIFEFISPTHCSMTFFWGSGKDMS